MSVHPEPTPSPSSAVPQVVNPVPELIHRKCKNCNRPFTAGGRSRNNARVPITKEFCSDKCRRQYHNNGSAYGKLRDNITRLVQKTAKEEVAAEFVKFTKGKEFKRALTDAGFIHRSQVQNNHVPSRLDEIERKLSQMELHAKF
jgi:hypothetical protein